MKKIYLIFLTVLILVNVGCTSEEVSNKSDIIIHKEYHVFQGESDNWEGKIIVAILKFLPK